MKFKSSLLFVFLTFYISSADAVKAKNIKIGKNIIPSAFVVALEQGMSVPVFLSFNKNKSENKVATANLSLENGKLKLISIDYSPSETESELSDKLVSNLEKAKESLFDENNSIRIDEDAILNLDLRSFNLDLEINKNAFSIKKNIRDNRLGPSTVENISTVINYDLGVYNDINKNQKNNTNSYINIDSTTSFLENHININGSAYEVGSADRNFELYRAMFERDYRGYRLALGLLSTWNLQSIASITALSSSKVYAVSFGNKSSSLKNTTTSSLTPIYAFLSSPGEVRIYRQGKLINIQNFPMGNFEIDTSKLPFGIYDVVVETVIDGNVTSTKNQTINKTLGAISNNLDRLDWEVYGGYVDYKRANNIISYNNNEGYSNQKSNPTGTYLAGISTATTLGILSGLNFQMSNYTFDNHLVMETGLNLAVNQSITLSLQSLLSNNSTYRNIISASAQLPGNIGTIWANKEKTVVKSDLPIYETNSYSYGSTINLNQLLDHAGSFTISKNHDKRTKSDNINYEYSNNLYSGRYGNVGLRLGVQRYTYENQRNIQEKFISLDFSLPLSTWLSTGASSSNGNIKANIYANKSFDDSVITSVGGSVSKLVRDKNDQESNFSTLAYTSYDAKYNSGTFTVNRPDSDRWSSNYTGKGSIAYSDGIIGASGNSGKSGIIVNPNIDGDGAMTAQVNGQNYQITGRSTFIPLEPYAEYRVELMNSGKSLDSFDIVSGRNKSVTLYPGNIATYTPNVRQLVTVFGRITTSDGTILANTPIKNHIGKTKTNHNGEFSMDVDTRYPIISVMNKDNAICEADLDLSNANGALWLGDIICNEQATLASR